MMVKTVSRRLAVLAVAAAVAVSCTPRSGEDVAKPAEAASGSGASPSLLGAFLAGRLAHAGGDTRAAADYYAAALARDPDNTELLQRAFTLLVAEGRLAEAVPLAERLLTYDADAAIPLLVMGVVDAREGRFDAAEARFAALPRRGIATLLAPLATGWMRAGQGRTDSAMDSLAALAETKGAEALHAFHSGLINDLADRPVAAEDNYRLALAAPLAIRTIEAVGSFYQRTGRIDRAKALYDQYVAQHPETLLFDGKPLLAAGAALPRAVPDAKAGLAQALFDTASLMRQGSGWDMALILTRLALAAQPDFPLAQMMLGDALSAQGRLEEANAVFRAIRPDVPGHVFARMKVAVNLDELGRTDEALAEVAEIAKAVPGSIEPLVTKGDILRRHKRFHEAADAYGEAVARLPQPERRHWVLFYARGIAFERSGRWPQAEADFNTALTLSPDQPDVLNYLGYTWVDRGVNLAQARAMIEKAATLRPDDGAIIDSLGWALYRMGDFVGAVAALERAIELRPEDVTINDHLGDAYWQVGRVHEARFQWQRALTLGPEPELLEALKLKVQTGELPARPLAQ